MSALLEAVKDRFPRQPPKAPTVLPVEISKKQTRAREAMRKDAPLRRVCVKFWQGEHYWYVNSKNQLQVLPTALLDPGKQDHRIRNTYNFAHSIVEGKVSAASQRVPGYEVDPSNSDQGSVAGARIAQQVAIYGYDKWRLRRQTVKMITNAIVQREGFVFPYFDPNVGPFIQQEDGSYLGLGEIKFLNLNRSEVGWEPGEDFEDSRFYIIERARLIENVKKIPGYIVGNLEPNASTADVPQDKRTDDRAVVTEYLERPCPDYPQGRRMFSVDKRIIVDYRRDPDCPPDWTDWWAPYPHEDDQGNVLDEPCIHRLSYTVDPEGDDRGLMEHLIDLSRTINDCWNKLLEWKNRCLMPQMSAPKGSNVTRRDDTPGATWYYNPIGQNKPEWEVPPKIPQELFQMLDKAEQTLRALAADIDAQPDPGLAGKTLNAAIEQTQSRWQSFLGDLETVHSQIMRHCLTLVAKHYTEQRIMAIRGQYGWEPVKSFTGQDMNSQLNVRVLPGSLEAKSRAQVLQEIEFVQTNWPGAISPEAALAAIHGGQSEGLLKSYTLDVERAWKICITLAQGPQAMLSFQPRYDPELGDPLQGFMVPGWMPRKVDNVAIWKQVVSDFMKSDQYDSFPPEMQHVYDLVYNGLEMVEQRRAMVIASTQQDMAAELGAENAARPQSQIPMAAPAGLSPQQAAPGHGAPQQ